MKKLSLLSCCLFILITSTLNAQDFISVPFNSENWNFGNLDTEVETYMGKQSYRLNGATISTKEVDLMNGTIEIDINFPYGRFFPAILFRFQDGDNAESFYVRPHQSGNPDATQYTPFFNSYSGWQLYHGEGHSAAVELEPDTWHHIKIDILDDQADIYFGDMETPLIKVTDLKRDPVSGGIGLSSGAPVYFANLKYSTSNPTLTERNNTKEEIPKGLVKEWYITDIVSDVDYRNKSSIHPGNLKWTKQPTEYTGTINLAKFVQSEEGKTTVLTKLNIESESEIYKRLDFGYSDFVWVYVNGNPVYSGRNEFMSRDYRYLGTIGWFDSVYLPLKKGLNEVMFVVGENFGGWGLKAKIENMEGITLK
ncbi:MAG: hypothetical protein JJ971_07795 [Balneolaceae bacterium]|nr:hypothetical protein [Balneolaceae bacterium]MBO6546862.1 hypothetical protein [Balneolaceae bacterium]MBO6649222.1 hypothetical protein [Balneolaceae bacterium]